MDASASFGNAHSGIANAKDDLAAFAVGGERDLAAVVGVLGGVVEQVGENLGEPRKIAPDAHRLRRRAHRERVAARVDERPRGLDGDADDFGDVDRFELELDLPVRDPRHVEKVVDQAAQLLDLAIEHVPRPFDLRRIPGAQHVNGIGDRRQRIAELVREHRQELVLPPVLVAHLLVEERVVRWRSPPRSARSAAIDRRCAS